MDIPDTLPIIGSPQLAYAPLVALLQRRNVPQADAIAAAYVTYGTLSGIGSLVPLAQAILETGCFTSARWVQACNPAGLGATNDGAWGGTFASPAAGIIAQYAHLLAYACPAAQLTPVQQRLIAFDPRLVALERAGLRGVAPRWIDLNGRWAVPGLIYGQTILRLARTLGAASG